MYHLKSWTATLQYQDGTSQIRIFLLTLAMNIFVCSPFVSSIFECYQLIYATIQPTCILSHFCPHGRFIFENDFLHSTRIVYKQLNVATSINAVTRISIYQDDLKTSAKTHIGEPS